MRVEVILLALGASCFTALASVAQRLAAAPAPDELRLSLRLIGYLARRPMWFLGILAMILGFLLQVGALRVGRLSVVQPLIATELAIVFLFIAIRGRRRVQGRDWAAAVGMVVGLALFLSLAHPQGGGKHANLTHWLVAALAIFGLAAALTMLAYVPTGGRSSTSSGRRAAFLGVAAASGFGFVAAVVKELSTHLHQGPAGIFLSWSPYALLIAGAVSMFLASNAFQAGSLAASQPGLTIGDPLVASILGVALFGERLNLQPSAVAGEAVAVLVIVISVVVLSRSPLIQDHDRPKKRPGESGTESGGRTSAVHDAGGTASRLAGVRSDHAADSSSERGEGRQATNTGVLGLAGDEAPNERRSTSGCGPGPAWTRQRGRSCGSSIESPMRGCRPRAHHRLDRLR